jgi:hypothetical protein
VKAYVDRRRYLQSQGWKLVSFAPELWTDPHQGEQPRYDGGVPWADAVFIARRRERDRERRKLLKHGFTRGKRGWELRGHPQLGPWRRVQAVAYVENFSNPRKTAFRGRG